MKNKFLNKAFKSIAAIVLISMVASSCSVTYRERHRRPPPPKEKVIIVH